jgi:hypothetical protein
MIPRHIYQQLYGQPRDGYQGEHLPAVAEVREPVRLLAYDRIGNGLQVDILDGETYRRVLVEHADDAELMRLGDYDRATLQAALILMAQEVSDAS